MNDVNDQDQGGAGLHIALPSFRPHEGPLPRFEARETVVPETVRNGGGNSFRCG